MTTAPGAEDAPHDVIALVVVRPVDDAQLLSIGAQENLQRQDLEPIEEAQIVAWHEQMFFEKNQAEIGVMLGKSSDWVSTRSRIHKLPDILVTPAGMMVAAQCRAANASRRRCPDTGVLCNPAICLPRPPIPAWQPTGFSGACPISRLLPADAVLPCWPATTSEDPCATGDGDIWDADFLSW